MTNKDQGQWQRNKSNEHMQSWGNGTLKGKRKGQGKGAITLKVKERVKGKGTYMERGGTC